MGKSIDRSVRTIVLPVPGREWVSVASALTREAKNLYNVTTFLVRQVVSSYDYDGAAKTYRLKAELHPNQSDTITRFNAVIDAVNGKKQLKSDKAKVIPRLEAEMVRPPLHSILNLTVIDTMARAQADGSGSSVYRRLPAASAQQVVLSAVDVWKAALAAMAAYAKNPASFTGRPGFPDFLAKDDHYPLELPYAALKPGFPMPRMIGAFGDVTVASQKRFYGFDVKAAIAASCDKRGWADYRPRHVRIVGAGKALKLEAVIGLNQKFPEGSFLHGLFADHGEVLRTHDTVAKRETFVKALLARRTDLRLAGIDMGLGNVCAVAFSTGNRGLVHDAGRLRSKMEKFDAKLDGMLAALTTPRMRELQAKKEREKLSKAERTELRKAQKAVFADPDYRRVVRDKGNVKADFEHKISHDIVETCQRHGIDVIVIGRNKRWKEQSMGAEKNRAFYSIAHARLISLVRYKAEAHGIAVLTTEESYTSQSSFVDNDPLPIYEEGKKNEATFSGTRSTKDRNWFVRRNDVVKSERFRKVHADINAAFNIIRKLFTSFRFSGRLTFKYTVRWISPRIGATGPMSCR
ncbi:transposase [Agrobacterium salinitolerans]|nr:transposase [Agrobacterium salinitolerans]